MKSNRPPRPCKYCGIAGTHLEFACFKKPKVGTKQYKAMNPMGKEYHEWQNTKKKWFKLNPFPYYACHYCGKGLAKEQTTLDHRQPRSTHPQLRHDLGNLVACCWTCNGEKGSMNEEAYLNYRSRKEG